MSRVSASDEELMQAYRLGDKSAFAELYRRYEARIYSFFSLRLPIGKASLAPDLFQKTWLKLHFARKNFDTSKKFSTWIYTIAMNTLRDELRLGFHRAESYELSEETADGESDTPETGLLKKLEQERLHSALEILPDPQRQAIMLSEWDGLSGREIAELLGMTENSVRQVLFRARKALRDLLIEDEK